MARFDRTVSAANRRSLRCTSFRLRRPVAHSAGLPGQVFVSEKMPLKFLGGEIRKPQYLNFSSPLFLPIIRSIMKAGLPRLWFEEMLPLPENYPKDAAGRQGATEIQLDTLALRTTRRSTSTSVSKPKPLKNESPHHGGVD